MREQRSVKDSAREGLRFIRVDECENCYEILPSGGIKDILPVGRKRKQDAEADFGFELVIKLKIRIDYHHIL